MYSQVLNTGDKKGGTMEKKLVITINREYGSGGRLIGKALAQRLDIPYYDDEILQMASEHSAVAEEYFRLNDERPGNNLLQRIIGGMRSRIEKPSIGDNITSPDNLFRFESEVIRKLAENESCILIGRCSDFVLASGGFEDFISLFVYADLPTKVNRVVEVDGIDTKAALARVTKMNRLRKEYYRYYSGEGWDDMSRYDLPINTTKLSLDQTVELILKYLSLRGYETNEG